MISELCKETFLERFEFNSDVRLEEEFQSILMTVKRNFEIHINMNRSFASEEHFLTKSVK